jgi:hypothetical protein
MEGASFFNTLDKVGQEYGVHFSEDELRDMEKVCPATPNLVTAAGYDDDERKILAELGGTPMQKLDWNQPERRELKGFMAKAQDMDAVMDKIVEKQQNVDRLLANMKKQYRKLKKKETKQRKARGKGGKKKQKRAAEAKGAAEEKFQHPLDEHNDFKDEKDSDNSYTASAKDEAPDDNSGMTKNAPSDDGNYRHPLDEHFDEAFKPEAKDAEEELDDAMREAKHAEEELDDDEEDFDEDELDSFKEDEEQFLGSFYKMQNCLDGLSGTLRRKIEESENRLSEARTGKPANNENEAEHDSEDRWGWAVDSEEVDFADELDRIDELLVHRFAEIPGLNPFKEDEKEEEESKSNEGGLPMGQQTLKMYNEFLEAEVVHKEEELAELEELHELQKEKAAAQAELEDLEDRQEAQKLKAEQMDEFEQLAEMEQRQVERELQIAELELVKDLQDQKEAAKLELDALEDEQVERELQMMKDIASQAEKQFEQLVKGIINNVSPSLLAALEF